MPIDDNTLDYEKMRQNALRGVIAEILQDVAENGLPTASHFFIIFRTDYLGVDIPQFLRDQYPEKMAIILQHEFYDLTVSDDRFSVALSFNNTPHTLVIPLKAIEKFHDPSVDFEIEFSIETPSKTSSIVLLTTEEAQELLRASSQEKPHQKSKSDSTKTEPEKDSSTADIIPVIPPSKEGTKNSSSSKEDGEVVQLDTFRKK